MPWRYALWFVRDPRGNAGGLRRGPADVFELWKGYAVSDIPHRLRVAFTPLPGWPAPT
jgi:hypothetical protein